MGALSSNAFSTDQQLADVINYGLTDEQSAAFRAEFPEWDNLTWAGSWVDADASGVDPEYASWAIEWIESHTAIYWEEGEPWLPAADESPDEEDESPDEEDESPDTCLNPIDGHWYVITYGRARYEIHAVDCRTCQPTTEEH